MTGTPVDAAPLRRRLTALRDATAILERHQIPLEHDGEAVAALLLHADGRLRHGTDATLVALAGGTGSGKSTLTNAVAGETVSRSGVTRPTTSVTQAVVFGTDADGLLDHVGVSRRHRIDHDGPLRGLVLLDLPDFDSVASGHREEVDRLIGLVDLLVWVTDPQKYADQALHRGYLRPLATHAEVVQVVLNKADLLDAPNQAACLVDLGRLLAEDGLGGVTPMAVSATTGEGLESLVGLLAGEVQAREAAMVRIGADVRVAASALDGALGAVRTTVPDAVQQDLVDGLAGAAGVDRVAGLVAAQHRRDAAIATGWPLVRWVRRLRRAPLTRLHSSSGSTVAGAEVSRALRRVAGAIVTTEGGAADDAVTAHLRQVADPLMGSLDTRMARRTEDLRDAPAWWRLAGILQMALIGVAVLGGVWLGGLALADSFLRLDVDLLAPSVGEVPLPTALLGGGLAAGLLLSLLARVLSALGARRRATRASRSLRAVVAEAAEAEVLDPLRALLGDLGDVEALLAVARDGERG